MPWFNKQSISMRNFIKKIINKFGYRISRVSKKYDLINFDELLREKIKKENPIIFDVGGNAGALLKDLKKFLINQLFILLSQIKRFSKL